MAHSINDTCVCVCVEEADVLLKSTYLNLTSLRRASITVAPPKECPTAAILHRSMEFCCRGDHRTWTVSDHNERLIKHTDEASVSPRRSL